MKKSISIILALILMLVPLTPGLAASKDEVKIVRDNYGVPHIYADNTEDLYKAYGYVMAKDRLFQLEMFKRGNKGTVAEVFGDQYLEHDKIVRRDGYTDKEIKKMIKEMEPFSQTVIHSFASGISTYVKEALKDPKEKLPKEYFDYNFKPEQWDAVDVARLFMASMTFFMDVPAELQTMQTLSALEKQYGKEEALKIFNDIYPVNVPDAPTSAPNSPSSNIQDPNHAENVEIIRLANAAEEALKQKQTFIARTAELGLPLKVGSNAMVVAPKKSKTNNTLVYGGPQVGFSAPGFMYEVGLHSPTMDIVGSAFIGYPFIMFGTTKDFAFTSTAGMDNGTDIFIEKLNPDNQHQYWFKGKWKEMEKKVADIVMKKEDGTKETVEAVSYHTVHGPVIKFDAENNIAFSKAWAFRGTEMETWEAYLESNYAKDMGDFASAARDVTMSLNWLYGDKDGNIGYYHVGKYPIRAEGIDPRLPTPGTGEFEWQGFLDMEKNPYTENPAQGFIANWNNKPAPNWTNGEMSNMWGTDHRVQQYIDLAKADDNITLSEIDSFNYHASFVNLKTRWFKPYLLDALSEKTGEKYRNVYKLLINWNNLNEDLNQDGYYDSPAVTIFEAWYSQFVENTFKPVLGDFLFSSLEGMIDHRYGNGLLLRELQGENAKLPTQYSYIKNKDEMILDSFNEALTSLEKEYGEDRSDWLTPIRTMTFGDTSLIGVPHGYGSEKLVPVMNRGSENHYVELTENGPEGFNLNPPGQIGFVNKKGERKAHYDDQIEMFINWEYKPMLLTEDDVQEHAVSTTYLDF